jgi:hypothetical protein
MQTNYYIGMKVALLISDPWEFGTECGVGPFYGQISDINKERILVKLDNSIKYLKNYYTSVICDIRHEGISFDDLLKNHLVSVNMILVSIQCEKLVAIMDDDIRSGFAATGTIEKLEENKKTRKGRLGVRS